MLYVVGITDNTDAKELAALSSGDQMENHTWWNAPSFNTLKAFEETLLQTTCVQRCESKKQGKDYKQNIMITLCEFENVVIRGQLYLEAKLKILNV